MAATVVAGIGGSGPTTTNTPPTVDAGGPYSRTGSGSISLSSATCTDPDPDTLTYLWTFISGTGAGEACENAGFSSATALNPTLNTLVSDAGADPDCVVQLQCDDGTASPTDTANVSVAVAGASVWTPAFTATTLGSSATDGNTLSGRPPMPVNFDAAPTTWTNSGDEEVEGAAGFNWDFDDPGSGSWTLSGVSISKNAMQSPMGSHVYEDAGTYTAALNLDDALGNGDSTDSTTITISNTAWTAGETVCFSKSSFGSECTGATQTAFTAWSQLVSAGCFNASSDIRCLLRAGESFVGAQIVPTNAGWKLLSRHGTGADPIITYSSSSGQFVQSEGVDMFVLDQIELTGGGADDGDLNLVAARVNTIASGDLMMSRVTLTPDTVHAVATFSNSAKIHQDFWIYELTATNLGLVTSTPGSSTPALFWGGKRLSILGTEMLDCYSGTPEKGCEHIVRVQSGEDSVIYANHFGGEYQGKRPLTIRSGTGQVTQRINVSRNWIQIRDGSTTGGLRLGGANNPGETNAFQYLWAFGNHISAWATPLDSIERGLIIKPGSSSSTSSSYIRRVVVLDTTCDMAGWDDFGKVVKHRCVWFTAGAGCGVTACDEIHAYGTTVYGATNDVEGGSTSMTECGNEVIYNGGGGTSEGACNASGTNHGGNLVTASDPFDAVAGVPTDRDSFRITTSSALAGNGVDIPSLSGVAITKDGFGNARPLGAGWDTAAHEVAEP